MICPKCGEENPETAGECSNCFYKFRFGHAYNDPAHLSFPIEIKSSENKRTKIMKYIFLLFIALVILLAIIVSFQQAAH